jgi:hypothetical protein
VTIDCTLDVNNNGVIDSGDTYVKSVSTASDGSYLCDGLPISSQSGVPTRYFIKVTDRDGVLSGLSETVRGSVGVNNNHQNPNGYAVILSADKPQDLTGDFGYVTGSVGSVKGQVLDAFCENGAAVIRGCAYNSAAPDTPVSVTITVNDGGRVTERTVMANSQTTPGTFSDPICAGPVGFSVSFPVASQPSTFSVKVVGAIGAGPTVVLKDQTGAQCPGILGGATPTPTATPPGQTACVGVDTTTVKLDLDGIAHDMSDFITKRLIPILQSEAKNKLSGRELRSLMRRVNQAAIRSERLKVEAWTTVWVTIPQNLQFCANAPTCVAPEGASALNVYQSKVAEVYAIGNRLIAEFAKVRGAGEPKKVKAQFDGLYNTAVGRIKGLQTSLNQLTNVEQAAGACKRKASNSSRR